jgi:hypothetical protein
VDSNGVVIGTRFAHSVEPENPRSTTVVAFPLHVVRREEGSPLLYLPLMVLDKTRKLRIDSVRILRKIVVLREAHFIDRIVYYEGMIDVFAIKEMKIRGQEAFSSIPITDFNLNIDLKGYQLYEEVAMLQVRSRMTASIHDALDKAANDGKCSTDFVFVSRNDVQFLFSALGGTILKTNDAVGKSLKYNLEPGGTAVIVQIQNRKTVLEISSVDLFEDMFGYISTFKYLCGKAIRSYPSMETIPRSKIAMTDDRKFVLMKMTYDSSNERCKFEFNITAPPFQEIIKYGDERRARFLSLHVDPYVNTQVTSSSLPSSTVDSNTVTYGESIVGDNRPFITSSQHRQEATSSSINDISILERMIVSKIGQPAVYWNSNLIWVIKQLKTNSLCHLSIYQGVFECCTGYSFNLDCILRSFRLEFDVSMKKQQKIILFANTLQQLYDEGKTSNIA